MKNLIVETQETSTFNDDDFLPNEKLQCFYNYDENQYYLLEGDELELTVIDVANKKKCNKEVISLKEEKITPVAIDYSSIEREIYVGTKQGAILCVTAIIYDDQFKYEELACLDSGISCMKLSPDQEVMAVLTKNNTVVTLSSNFDILKESNLLSAEFGEKQFITVGWGKKETQFHGSEGKGARVKMTVAGKTATDNGLPKITWRGDGSMFAVSYIDPKADARRFKVFDREGVLQYTSELVDCLEGTLSWKPSGNLIASTRKLPNKHTVALFEKNGLLHREFILPFGQKNVQIIDLIWSRDSDILSVWYMDIESKAMTIQLWSEKNYHWYLKQTINYPAKNPILLVTWSPVYNKDLVVLSSKNSTTYTFNWVVSHSQGKELSDKAVVGVIDGDKILVTGFRDGIVPPPMAQQTLQFEEPVNAISFAPTISEDSNTNCNDFIALLSSNKIVLCKNINESWESQYSCQQIYKVNLQLKEAKKFSFHLIHHLFWFKPKVILCSVSKGEKSSLCELHLLDVDGLDEIIVEARTVQEMPGQIEHIVPSADSRSVCIVVSGKLYTYNERDGVLRSSASATGEGAPRAVAKLECARFGAAVAVVALTRKHVLHVDGKQVANNVTSFFVHSEFLLLTTTQHTLICFKLDDNGLRQLCTSDLTIQPWELKSFDFNGLLRSQEMSIRRVERGSTLVVAVPKDARTVLQMPRGNLECIQPRALSLVIIGTFIDALNYHAAFDLMRKQRIDLNLLHDHNPEAFLENVQKFVDEIKNANWLSLFLTELKDEDVTKTTYASSYSERKGDYTIPGKVEKVCEVIRKILEKNSNDFIQPILISLVKSQKKNGLEAALMKIKELKNQENAAAGAVTAEEALKYLLYMVDVNKLYDVALGTYDFELVMLVAQRSQRDPKEYISFLNALRNLDENYRKFTIDSHLKRFDSALEHLSRIPDRFNELLLFITCHGLYAKALGLFPVRGPQYRRIAMEYGQYLAGKAKHREAGIMFAKAEQHAEALNAFKLALSWQDAIVTAIKLDLSPRELTELCEELVTRLMEDKRYDEAAVILMKRLNRFEDAVATLCEGRQWHEAWTECYCNKRQDLIETHVKPGLLEHAEFTLSQLRERRRDFERHRARLAVVRAQAAAARELHLRAQYEPEDEECSRPGRELSDLLSDTTSVAGSTVTRTSQASRSTTGRSYRSSKNRRKHERKLQSIKEGGVYEDLALIRALHQLVSRTFEQREEIRSLAEMLLQINSDALAAQLYKVMNELLDDIHKGKREIWPPIVENKTSDEEPSTNSSTNISPVHSNIPANLIEPHLLHPPEEKPSDWRLHIFSVQ